MNYGEVLTRAWKIIWRYKILWLFGIFTGSVSGGSASSGRSSNINFLQEMPPEVAVFFERLLDAIQRPAIITGIITGALLIIALSIFLGTIGQIGLISGTLKAERGVERLTFGELFREGTSHFWRFFGMSFFVGLPFLIVIFGLLGAMIFTAVATDSAGNDAAAVFAAFIPVLCTLFCILFFFSVVVGMILQQAKNAMIVEELGIINALKRGWEVFKNNLGSIFLIAVILFIVGVVAGMLTALPVILIVFPTMLAFVLEEVQSMQPLIVMGLCLVAYLPVLLVLNGILTAYIQSAWTLTYLQITDQSPQPEEIQDNVIEYA